MRKTDEEKSVKISSKMTGGDGVGVLAVNGANPRRKLMRERRETETTNTQINICMLKNNDFYSMYTCCALDGQLNFSNRRTTQTPIKSRKCRQVKQGSNPSNSRRYPGLTKTLEVSFDWQQNHCCYYHRACFLEDPAENIQPEILSDFLHPQQQHLR